MRIRPSKHTGEVVMEVNRRDEPLLTEAVATPFRLKKILVPTDFSDCSKKAIQYALPLAQQHHAEIVLLYVAPSPSYAGGEYGVIDCSALNAELCATGEKRLEALVNSRVGKPGMYTYAVPGLAVLCHCTLLYYFIVLRNSTSSLGVISAFTR